MSRVRTLFFLSCVFLSFSFGVLFTVFFLPAKKTSNDQCTSITCTTDGTKDSVKVEKASTRFLENTQKATNDFLSDEDINIRVYDLRNKGVVNITTEILAYNWFFEPVPKDGNTGSGSIIDKRGYILTNYHVIAGSQRLFVTLWDETRVEAQIIGSDVENDLAILKIDVKNKNLEIIPIGDSELLRVGQKVISIGNPFGFDRTLTTGVISGLRRPIRNSNNIVIRDMIQTDASINPGNSGGPLLDSEGNIIGVNTLIYSPTRGSIGLGFAVPAATVRRVVDDIFTYGKVQRGWIEWKVQPLFGELVKYANLPVNKGLLVVSLPKTSNAYKIGIRGGNKNKAIRYGRTIIYMGGDIITNINGITVFSTSGLLEALEQTRPGDVVKIEYIRKNKKKKVNLILSDRPKDLVIE